MIRKMRPKRTEEIGFTAILPEKMRRKKEE